MYRAPNPFDTRLGHAAQRLASGGANCSTCSSCCSSVVTAIAVSVLSSRMVAQAVPPAPAAPATAADVSPGLAQRVLRILVGALLPVATIAVLGFVAAAVVDGQHEPWLLLAFLLLVPLWLAVQFATRGNNRLRWKLALLILIAFPLLLVGEMFLWISWR